jgi:molybdate transport system substrate-binding protein
MIFSEMAAELAESASLKEVAAMREIVRKLGLALVLASTSASLAAAADIKLLTAGAYAQVVEALVPDFESRTGHKVTIDRGTAGGLKSRIESGELFDVAIITPAVIEALVKNGRVVSQSHTKVAIVGVGVGIREGAPRPDISSVESFKRALVAARAVAYIDPASGGTSGIFVDKLLERLGIADQVRPKAKLKKGGGHAADFVANGEAEIVLQQMSEIVPVKGVTVVGPLPAEIQNITTYSAAISAQSKAADAAQALLKVLSGPQAAALLKAKGMQPAS